MVAEYDFIVVGSGAGGGPLACNLALAPEGYRVALLEAGTDPLVPGTPSFFNHAVPGLHPRSTEDPATSWEFFVRHYNDLKRDSEDTVKFNEANGGVFYPRAAAVGGCTAHHAMITIAPHNDDWQQIHDLTGDKTWLPDNMRKYFERIEACQYLTPATPGQARDQVTRHGFNGWLPLSTPDPTLVFGGGVLDANALKENQLLVIVVYAFLIAHADAAAGGTPAQGADAATAEKLTSSLEKGIDLLLKGAEQAVAGQSGRDQSALARLRVDIELLLREGRKPGKKQRSVADIIRQYAENPHLYELFRLALAHLDPNRWFASDKDRVGPFATPASILHGARTGVRERILAVKALYPDRLDLITGALATEVILEKDTAVGVRYLEGARLYQATPGFVSPEGKAKKEIRVRARGEVILAGGTFNTPQLLMLSGIGPGLKYDLPGVGQNLQDRYEITLVSELDKPFPILAGATFRAPGETDGACPQVKPAEKVDGQPTLPDPIEEWQNHRGVYATNGAVLTIIKRSTQADKDKDIPDLFLFGVPGYFRGYYKGYSCDLQTEKLKDGSLVENHKRFTWAILKGRTRYHNGEVKLKDNNPCSRPDINFRYFDDSEGEWQKDVTALKEGILLAVKIMAGSGLNPKFIVPTPDVLANSEELEKFIKRESWGHHACGTSKLGADNDPKAVLDGDFRVRGVKNLRVVDASVFPKIPGFFIVSSVYMISEKASDVILRDRRNPPRDWAKAPPKQ